MATERVVSIAWVGAQKQIIWMLTASTLMLIAGLFGFPSVVMLGHPVQIYRLSRIQLGSTPDEVKRVAQWPEIIDREDGTFIEGVRAGIDDKHDAAKNRNVEAISEGGCDWRRGVSPAVAHRSCIPHHFESSRVLNAIVT